MEELRKGNFTDGAFKGASYQSIMSKFNSQANVHYTITQLQSKLSELKHKYKLFSSVVNNSGFDWNLSRLKAWRIMRIFLFFSVERYCMT